MTKYKILLKKHWKKRESRSERTERKKGPSDPEPPDLGDLEVETSTRSLYSRTLRLPPPGNPEVRDRIRMYRVISSVLVYGMIFSMLCFSSKFVNTTLKEVDAKKKKETERETAVVTRKMRTNYTQDEEMSRLSYDAFVQKVEEEIKNKKRMRIVPVHQKGQKNSTTGNSTLASRKEIGLKAFQSRFSTPSSVELKAKGKTEVASAGEIDKKEAGTHTPSKQTVLEPPVQRDASVSAGNHVNTGPVYQQQTQNTQLRQPGGSSGMYLSLTSANVAAADTRSSGLLRAGAISQQPQAGLSTNSLVNNQLMPQQPLIFPGTSTNMMNQQQAGAVLPLQTYSLQTTTPQLSNVPNTLSSGNQFPSYEAFIAQFQNQIANPMPQLPVYVPQNSPFLSKGAMTMQQLPQSHP